MPSSPTATPARWWRPTARSTGCACRASIRRASSAPCSTARPAASGSGRSASPCPTGGPTSPDQHPRHDLEYADRAGWSCATRSTMGPRSGEDRVTPHTRPPADDDADHLLVRTVQCIEGEVEIELICEPVFDYGRAAFDWTMLDDHHHLADAAAPATRCACAADMHLGVEGGRVRGAPRADAGERAVLRPVLGRGPRRAARRGRGRRAHRGDVALLARLAGSRADPRPPLARRHPALRAGDQGPDLHADRRDGGSADDVAARDAGRRAQLGLPLHAGCATRPSPCRRCTS